jgi:hypothetical protein
MADRLVANGVQSIARSSDIAFGDTQFKLSDVADADVSGMGGMAGKISAGRVVFGLDMVQ